MSPALAVVPLLLAVPALSGCGTSRLDGGGAGSSNSPAVSVQAAPVTVADFPRTVEITGAVAPEFEADLSTRIMGRIQSVLVKEGEYVHRRQPLVQLDSGDLDAAVTQAKADVDAAVTGVGNAKAALAMEQASSPARIREAQARVAEAAAAVNAAQAQRDLVMAGPRRQERQRSAESVAEAEASLTLARNTFQRMSRLYDKQAISGQDYDQARSAWDSAQARYQSALLALSQTQEGSRPQEKRAAANAVREAQAQLAQARAGLAQAQAGALTVDLRRADLVHAESGVAQARAALDQAEANRAYATIRAPFDGIVTGRFVDPGAMAGPGVPLLKIEGGTMRLEASVPESALGAVKLGGAVGVTLAAAPGRAVRGRVVTVARQGDAASHTFLAKIELPRDSGAVSGMYGRATLTVGIDRHPSIPASALVSRDGLNYVFVVGDDGVARLRFVTTGAEQDGRIPALSGAEPGDRVVVGDLASVSDGARIAVSGQSAASAQAASGRN